MIKPIIQAFLVNAMALWVADYFLTGFNIDNNVKVFSIAAGVLIVVNFAVRPLLELISFPINLITLGLFSWIINVALIYIVVLLVDGIKLSSGVLLLDKFGPLSITLPNIQLGEFLTLIVATFIIGLVNWVLRKLIF